MRAHAARSNGCAGISDLASLVLGGNEYVQTTNLLYGGLAQRLVDANKALTGFHGERR